MAVQEASDCHLVSDSVWVVCLHLKKKCEVVLLVIMNTSKGRCFKGSYLKSHCQLNLINVQNNTSVSCSSSSAYNSTATGGIVQSFVPNTISRMLYRSVDHSLESEISDADLDDAVSSIQQQNPNCGQGVLQGYLRERGIYIQRQQLRESVARTDPCRTWHQVISR